MRTPASWPLSMPTLKESKDLLLFLACFPNFSNHSVFIHIFDSSILIFIGGEIVSTFDSPELVKLGSCNLIEEVMVGEDRLLRFSGVPIGKIRSLLTKSDDFCSVLQCRYRFKLFFAFKVDS